MKKFINNTSNMMKHTSFYGWCIYCKMRHSPASLEDSEIQPDRYGYIYYCNRCGGYICGNHVIVWLNNERRCPICSGPILYEKIAESKTEYTHTFKVLYDGKINLMLLLDGLYIAGMQTHVLQLVHQLDKDTYNIHLFCLDGGGHLLEDFMEEVAYVSVHDKSISPDIIEELTQFIVANNIDVIHSHLFEPAEYGYLSINHSPTKLKHIITVHTAANPPYGEVVRPIAITALKCASMIISVSGDIKNVLVNRFGITPNKILIHHNMVDTDFFSPIPDGTKTKSKLGFSDDCFLLGTVGRLDKDKCGGRELLEAIALLVVGDGEDKKFLQEYSRKLGVAKRVNFLGFRRDVKSILAAIDCFILPTHNEGLPFSLLEAMAMSKAVIATNVGGVPECIEDKHNGLLCKPTDPRGLTSAIISIANDKEFRDLLGKKARATVESRFNLTTQKEFINNIYKKVLNVSTEGRVMGL